MFMRGAKAACAGLVLGSMVLLVRVRVAYAEPEMTLDLGSTSIELRRIPKGSYQRGSATTEVGHEKDEEPQHPVTITKDFFIGKAPVTRGQFAKFVADTRYLTDAEKNQTGGSGWDGKQLVQKKDFTWKTPGFTQTDDHPVVLVSWNDANAFVAWAAKKSGKRVRLPTEAEWEYAARGGTTSAWYGGKTEEDALLLGWFKPNSGNGTRPVGQRKANAFGLFDMAGDVFEWCRDVYVPYTAGAAADPEATSAGNGDPERRVLRGGSWARDPKRGRSAARHRNAPTSRNADNGFRIVVTDEDGSLAPAVGGGTTGVDSPHVNPVPLGSASASAAPAPSHDPAASATSAPSESFGWSLVAAPIGAALAVILWMLARRGSKGSLSTEGIRTRAAEDGFWIYAPDVPPGAHVRYRCRLGARPVTAVVAVEPGVETFVVTGSLPSAIEILEVLATHGQSAPAEDEVPLVPLAPVTARSSGVPPPPAPVVPSSRPKSIEPPPPSSKKAPSDMPPSIPPQPLSLPQPSPAVASPAPPEADNLPPIPPPPVKGEPHPVVPRPLPSSQETSAEGGPLAAPQEIIPEEILSNEALPPPPAPPSSAAVSKPPPPPPSSAAVSKPPPPAPSSAAPMSPSQKPPPLPSKRPALLTGPPPPDPAPSSKRTPEVASPKPPETNAEEPKPAEAAKAEEPKPTDAVKVEEKAENVEASNEVVKPTAIVSVVASPSAPAMTGPPPPDPAPEPAAKPPSIPPAPPAPTSSKPESLLAHLPPPESAPTASPAPPRPSQPAPAAGSKPAAGGKKTLTARPSTAPSPLRAVAITDDDDVPPPPPKPEAERDDDADKETAPLVPKDPLGNPRAY